MIHTSMLVLIRWGLLDPDTVWNELSSFSSGTIKYTLSQSNGVMNPELRQYLIEISAEGIPIRRAKVAALHTGKVGLTYEFFPVKPDPFVMLFEAVKPHYVNGVQDDWLTIAMSIGQWYYMNDLQILAAEAWEAEQVRQLVKDQQDFSIDIRGIDKLLRKDENDIDQPLDDIWNDWNEPDDDIYH